MEEKEELKYRNARVDRENRIMRYQGIFKTIMEEQDRSAERIEDGIDFKAITLDNGVKISYVEHGVTAKSIESEDKPRDELRLAMEYLVYHWTDEIGNKLYLEKGVARAPKKLKLKYDRKTGMLTHYAISGVETIAGDVSYTWFQSMWLPVYEKESEILEKIFDEAWLYINGIRKEENLFKPEEAEK